MNDPIFASHVSMLFIAFSQIKRSWTITLPPSWMNSIVFFEVFFPTEDPFTTGNGSSSFDLEILVKRLFARYCQPGLLSVRFLTGYIFSSSVAVAQRRGHATVLAESYNNLTIFIVSLFQRYLLTVAR